MTITKFTAAYMFGGFGGCRLGANATVARGR